MAIIPSFTEPPPLMGDKGTEVAMDAVLNPRRCLFQYGSVEAEIIPCIDESATFPEPAKYSLLHQLLRSDSKPRSPT